MTAHPSATGGQLSLVEHNQKPLQSIIAALTSHMFVSPLKFTGIFYAFDLSLWFSIPCPLLEQQKLSTQVLIGVTARESEREKQVQV